MPQRNSQRRDCRPDPSRLSGADTGATAVEGGRAAILRHLPVLALTDYECQILPECRNVQVERPSWTTCISW